MRESMILTITTESDSELSRKGLERLGSAQNTQADAVNLAHAALGADFAGPVTFQRFMENEKKRYAIWAKAGAAAN